jgi:hypothetical protein
VENELYLRQHPEIQSIVSYFLQRTLLEQPRNIEAFAVQILSDPDLKQKVEQAAATKIKDVSFLTE